MCGRYTLVSKLKLIEKTFEIDASSIADAFTMSVNISPGEQAVVITNDKPHEAQLFTFGMTPFWAKKPMYLINARAEGDYNKDNDPNYNGNMGIIKKPAFRKAIRSQRCLVIADAFIEGPTKEKLNKPYVIYTQKSKHPFAMAGIWDQWTDETTGELRSSFAIITCVPNKLLQAVGHHRSPVVLPRSHEKAWLYNETPLHEITAMLEPFDDTDFNAYPISSEIKSSKNKSPNLLAPTGPPIKKETTYAFYQELDLQGMGETTARQRKKTGEQGELF